MSSDLSAYSRIQRLCGMDEFKALANKLYKLSENRKVLSSAKIRLPNFLFASDEGCGVTTHLSLLTQLLNELKLQRFEGDRLFFETVLDRNAFGGNRGFDRLIDQTYAMAGFRNGFCGVIGIDIDDWVIHPNSEELKRLISFADAYQGEILLVFEVIRRSDDALSGLINRLSMNMPLERVDFPMPSPDQMCEYLIDFLKRRKFEVSEAAREYITKVMPEIMRIKDFDGFQTLDNLADEIAYRYLSKNSVTDNTISLDTLKFIGEKGGYISRLSSVTEKSIGFHARRD